MSSDVKYRSMEDLQNMSLTDLMNVGKIVGVYKKMKKGKLIKAILKAQDDNSFSTPENVLLNSSRKNKEEKFDADKNIPPETPRRGTYSLEDSSLSVLDVTKEINIVQSPSLDLSFQNVSLSRGSERKLRNRKVSFMRQDATENNGTVQSPILNLSIEDVSLNRESQRSLRNRKVSFMSPQFTPRTPRESNVKGRPKTPIVTRSSISKRVSFITPEKPKRKSRGKSLPPTPHPNNASLREILNETPNQELSIADIPEEMVNDVSNVSGVASEEKVLNLVPSMAMETEEKDDNIGLNLNKADVAESANTSVDLVNKQNFAPSAAMETEERDHNIGHQTKADVDESTNATLDLDRNSSSTGHDQTKVEDESTITTFSLKRESSLKSHDQTEVEDESITTFNLKGESSLKRSSKRSIVSAKRGLDSSVNSRRISTPYSTKKRSSFRAGSSVKATKTPNSSTKKLSLEKVVNTRKSPGSTTKVSVLVVGKNVQTAQTPNSSIKKLSFGKLVNAIKSPGSTSKALLVVGKKVQTAKTPNSSRKRSSVETGIKATKTPNFKKIHQKAFEKMESIADYQKRKDAMRGKPPGLKKGSKIPKPFSGLSFVPSVQPTKFNFAGDNAAKITKFTASLDSKSSTVDMARKENMPDKNRVVKRKRIEVVTPKIEVSEKDMPKKQKFDLQASLSRKLRYKPHTGPLKPLTENTTTTTSALCFHKGKDAPNPVVVECRNKSRDVLRGVRTNKRFELQMRNRKL